MTIQKHGEEGTAFPIEPGQTWQVGNHIFHCSDLMASTSFDEVLEAYWTPTLVYTDPPWGQGLVNSFRTTAGLEHADYRWEELYERITDMSVLYGVPLWQEGSSPDSKDGAAVLGTMQKAGEYQKAWRVTYYKKFPSGLYYAGTEPYPKPLKTSLVDMDDEVTPFEVMRHTAETGVVIDPCAGRGVTARCAEDAGWYSIMNELSPYRTSAGIVRMEKKTGETAQQLA